MENDAKGMVEAIEDGKIVRVSEEYARRERLMILRRIAVQTSEARQKVDVKKGLGEDKRYRFDDFRKPLNWKKNKIVEDLVENFHWQITAARKAKNLTRKQVAVSLGVQENAIKAIENGILPSEDFVLVNKIENYFGINLRKNRVNFSGSPREMLDSAMGGGGKEEKVEEKAEGKSQEKTEGNDIDIAENIDLD